MADQKCVACGSADTGALFDTFVCHRCGAVSNYRGELVSQPTTEPGIEAPATVIVSPTDTSNPDEASRQVTTIEPGDTFTSTETISAGNPGSPRVDPQPVVAADDSAPSPDSAPGDAPVGDVESPDSESVGTAATADEQPGPEEAQ